MNEVEVFWDEFSDEYQEIQEESKLPLSADVTNFLKKIGVFPASSLIDVAGGSGRYLLDFSKQLETYTLLDISTKMIEKAQSLAKDQRENCVFIHEEMNGFFEKTADNAYEYSYSAMNPGLQTVDELLELNRISEKGVFIFRLTENQDSLFSVIDNQLGIAQEEELSLISTYQKALHKVGILTQTKTFTYTYDEWVSREFLRAYYEDYRHDKEFQGRLDKWFLGNDEVNSHTVLTFTLFYWLKQ
ncbi:hypothetical protein IGI37_001938 [Enterococcus sp. AZ194]|uniref:class I SAM-dependent methyltransferase n=1 Tax=Enterococcus sp. AZ194 TaxID=2774629 RepID=UPI003F1FE5E0